MELLFNECCNTNFFRRHSSCTIVRLPYTISNVDAGLFKHLRLLDSSQMDFIYVTFTFFHRCGFCFYCLFVVHDSYG